MKNADQLISKLKGLYLPKHRYVNFGDVLLSMQTYGIRGMSASVNFDFPITVRFLYKGIIINHYKNRANLH